MSLELEPVTQYNGAYHEFVNGKLAKRFSSAVGGNNFMTPDILGYVEHGKYVIEVSEGIYLDKMIYGCSVVEEYDKKYIRNDELSRPFNTMEELEDYINSL